MTHDLSLTYEQSAFQALSGGADLWPCQAVVGYSQSFEPPCFLRRAPSENLSKLPLVDRPRAEADTSISHLMETMEVFLIKKPRRRVSNEFKAYAVSLVSNRGYSVSEAARRLGIERSMLDRWCRKHHQQVSSNPERQEDDRDAKIKNSAKKFISFRWKRIF